MIRSLVRSVIYDACVTHAGAPSVQVDAFVLRTLDHKPRVIRLDPQNRVLSAT